MAEIPDIWSIFRGCGGGGGGLEAPQGPQGPRDGRRILVATVLANGAG